ncbi:MAG: J domain-containing protein [Deltaproteobacteria bacterium]|nr:J domain-containing protein [Deltaproteobacteria bacterium]
MLDVDKEATAEDIKKSYRRLAMKYHPDINGNDPDGVELLKEINEAYDILGNESKRRQYDFISRKIDGEQGFYGSDLSDELNNILREFLHGSFVIRGYGGCRGGGFRRGGCGRWKWNQ